MSTSAKYFFYQNRLLTLIIVICAIFLGGMSIYTTTKQENALKSEAMNKMSVMINIISSFTKESMIKEDYIEAANFLENWFNQREDIVSLVVKLENGSVLTEIKREKKNSLPLKLTKTVEFPNNKLTIELTDDVSTLHESIKNMQVDMLTLSLGIIFLLGISLWYVLNRLAIIPMEREILERTVDLKNANIALEVAKNNAQNAAEHAHKANMAKSEFLANMSHEIRTPMNVILGFSELMAQNVTEPKHKEYIDGILIAGKSLINIINDILDLSKIEAAKLLIQNEPTNMYDLFNEFRPLFGIKAKEKGLSFDVNIDASLPIGLIVDETRVRQVLFNLAGNAIKFTHAGFVKLYVFAKEVRNDASRVELCFMVSDSGIGIPREQQTKIFEAFTQQDGQSTRRFGGSGLGLAITKKLVDLMGGIIELQSEVGKGSTFTVCIPCPIALSIHGMADTRSENIEYLFEKSTVLIVEDIPTNRTILKEYMGEQSFVIFEAENGKDGVDIAQKILPDLILMDIQMPVMDGYMAIDILKNDYRTKHIPIIAVTASAMYQDEEKIKKMCDGYLRKPIKKSELLGEIAHFLKHIKKTTKSSEESTPIERLEIEGEIKKRLIDELKNEYEATRELIINIDVEAFAKKLVAFAERECEPQIKEYGEHLIYLAKSFKLDEMEKEFLEFEDFLIQ